MAFAFLAFKSERRGGKGKDATFIIHKGCSGEEGREGEEVKEGRKGGGRRLCKL